MLIDTHCHLSLMTKKEFDIPTPDSDYPKIKTIVDDAKKSDVTTIINVATSLPESINCIKISNWFENIYSTVGIHPNDCTSKYKDELDEIKKLLKNKEQNKIVALGETGLDKHWPGYNLERQIDNFKRHIELSIKHELPLVIHLRKAVEDVLRTLEEFAPDAKGVFHCFSDNIEYANEAIKLGFLVGIGGPITYPKNTRQQEEIKQIDLQNIILETDAPFLPPQIIRGKQNRPEYVRHIAEFIAKLRNESFEKVAQQTTFNAKKMFHLDQK